MPLWYVGAGPDNPNDIATNNYTKSLVSRNLSQDSVTTSINNAFDTTLFSGPYGLVSYLKAKRDNASSSIALALQSLVDTGNENKILLSTIVDPASSLPTARPGDATTQALRGDDAVAASQSGSTAVLLDSSGKVPKSRISVGPGQRWLGGYWSPSSYGTAGSFTTESNLCSIPVNPLITGNYRVIVTGSVSAKSGADGQYPTIVVRVGPSAAGALTGTIVAKGYGVGENHLGGQLDTVRTAGTSTYSIPSWCNRIDVVAIGGGGGGLNGGVPFNNGGGGGAGSWQTTTLIRGTNGDHELPLSTTTLNYTVGAGAANQNQEFFFPSYNNGSPTTCTGIGMNPAISAGGGITGKNQGATMQGDSSIAFTTNNGLIYPAGGTAGDNSSSPAVPGNWPGGGGQGGRAELFSANPGASGASGAIFFYAYLTEDVNYGQITVGPHSSSVATTFTGTNTVWVNVLSSTSTGATGSSAVTTSSFNPQISVMVVPA